MAFSVTNTFVVNSRAKSADVNQNFTDVLGIFAGDHHNPNVYSNAQMITTSGIAPNAQIKDTQLALFTRAGLINTAGVITAAALAGLVNTKYGGTGADGALSISSGTTTLSAGNALVFVKNYTTISITGTGTLAFSNPNTNGTVVFLRATGAVTLTSSSTPMIDLRGMGAAGGGAQGPGVNSGGASGNNGFGLGAIITNKGAGGAAGAQGTAGANAAFDANSPTLTLYAGKYPWIVPGAGGSSGGISSGTGSYTSGIGGIGGGALIMECATTFNFTTGSISAAGQTGGNAVINSAGNTNAGGGGPGGGGTILITYNTLTANTGTTDVTAGGYGTGVANGGSPTTNQGGAGGAIKASGVGFALITANTEYV